MCFCVRLGVLDLEFYSNKCLMSGPVYDVFSVQLCVISLYEQDILCD